jgi:poly-gamma-glutamate synthesis protein (capsule biosynthesis protein)
MKGKPVIFSVGNFVMKETDNEFQRQAWLLKLYLDKRGVTRFDTLPVRIDMQGLPSVDNDTKSPCWTRGEKISRACVSNK